MFPQASSYLNGGQGSPGFMNSLMSLLSLILPYFGGQASYAPYGGQQPVGYPGGGYSYGPGAQQAPAGAMISPYAQAVPQWAAPQAGYGGGYPQMMQPAQAVSKPVYGGYPAGGQAAPGVPAQNSVMNMAANFRPVIVQNQSNAVPLGSRTGINASMYANSSLSMNGYPSY